MKTESERLKILLRSFERAEERVQSVLIKTAADNIEDLRLKISKKLDRVTVELTQASVRWAENDLPVAFREGERRIDGHITAGAAVNDTTVENSYIQLARNVQHASEHAKSLVDAAIKEAESGDGYGATVGGVKQAIEEALAKENASMTITYSNGAKVSLSSYAEMLARTSRIMTSNEGAFNRCHELGIDLVYCVPVDNCCPYCKRYEGKVYSISGKDKRFPALYETALSRGYDIMHPNCRHEFVPFVEDVYSREELEEMIKKSNEFQEYSKDDKLFRIYNRNQALLRQWNDERKEFDKMKIALGKDMPYTTLGGFRRARRAKSGQYIELKKKASDQEQYERWKNIVGDQNMPKTLENFQKMKYNNNNKFERLRDYKNSIKSGLLSPLVGFRRYSETKKKLEKTFIGTTTPDGTVVTGVSNHFMERFFGSVEKKRNGMPFSSVESCMKDGTPQGTKVDRFGRKSVSIVLENVCRISINPDNGILIQVNPLHGGRDE